MDPDLLTLAWVLGFVSACIVLRLVTDRPPVVENRDERPSSLPEWK
jgi:hypothetical protein